MKLQETSEDDSLVVKVTDFCQIHFRTLFLPCAMEQALWAMVARKKEHNYKLHCRCIMLVHTTFPKPTPKAALVTQAKACWGTP